MGGHYDLAAASYRKAHLVPARIYVDAHADLGSLLWMQGKFDEALASVRARRRARPATHAPARTRARHSPREPRQDRRGRSVLPARSRARTGTCPRASLPRKCARGTRRHGGSGGVLRAGREARAGQCSQAPYRGAIRAASSERAPSDYVEKLFDDYAQKFDSHLVQVLSYSVPKKLAALLRPHFDPDGEKWTILDLGCGTGLAGAEIAPFARQMVGCRSLLEDARQGSGKASIRPPRTDGSRHDDARGAGVELRPRLCSGCLCLPGQAGRLGEPSEEIATSGRTVRVLRRVIGGAEPRSRIARGASRLSAERLRALRAFERVPDRDGNPRRVSRC